MSWIVRAFLLGNLDYLAAGPFLAPHPKLADNMRARADRPAARQADLVGSR